LSISLLALLQTPAPGNRSFLVLMIYLVAFFLIMWFVVMRPNRKIQERHQAMLGALKKGDEVMTEGGIIGQVLHLSDDRVTLKTAENTRIVVARPKIARVLTEPAAVEEKS
jgi:preprotein translocase subunit YajC